MNGSFKLYQTDIHQESLTEHWYNKRKHFCIGVNYLQSLHFAEVQGPGILLQQGQPDHHAIYLHPVLFLGESVIKMCVILQGLS